MSIKTAQTLVSEAMQEIKTISADEAYKIFEENNCNLIDIRDTNELEITGAIENSINIPRGLLEFQLDPNGPLTQNGIIDPNKETSFILCSRWPVCFSNQNFTRNGL